MVQQDQNFLPLWRWIIFQSVYISSSSCFCLLAIVTNTTIHVGMKQSFPDPDFSSFGEIPWSGIAGSYVSFGLLQWLIGKESTCNAGDRGSILGPGRFPGGRHGYPLQYSCLENLMDKGARRATVHGVAKSWTRLKHLSRQAGMVVLFVIYWWHCIHMKSSVMISYY